MVVIFDFRGMEIKMTNKSLKEEFENNFKKQGGRFYETRDIIVFNALCDDIWSWFEQTLKEREKEIEKILQMEFLDISDDVTTTEEDTRLRKLYRSSKKSLKSKP